MQLASYGGVLAAAVLLAGACGSAAAADRVKTANGEVSVGAVKDGVRAYLGIPFAAPPVGALRWVAPQPAKNWKGARPGSAFGPRCMQQSLFSDMIFRSNGMGEDCLYLNVWTPAKTGKERLPVLVYFYGGGFVSGDGSESRYDGESMARKGMVALTVNYRVGVFGFFAHPELSKEAGYGGSGNYGLLDQHAALRWVQANIARFGGDPANVTIAGESAGSISVSAQMASPLSKGLIAAAIGESGSVMGALSAVPLEAAEQVGVKWASLVGAGSLAVLREMTGQQLLDAAAKNRAIRFSPTIDGYFFPESPFAIYAAGKQARVPLLAGWNSEEMNGRALLGAQGPTVEGYEKAVRALYKERAEEVLKAYPGGTAEEVAASATDLAGDRFIAYSTWKWIDVHARTAGQPVYRYYYSRPRPALAAAPASGPAPPAAKGAVHSAEIEYAMGNLDGNKTYAWTAEDRKVSQVMQQYFANFVKTKNPNGAGLPEWPALRAGAEARVMRIDVETKAEPEMHRARYLLLDAIAGQAAK